MTFKFDLADTVRDTLTKFTGVIVSRTQWLNGCIRYAVQPAKLTKDGKVADAEHFDEQQLEIVKKAAVPKAALVKRGGPQADQRSPFRT